MATKTIPVNNYNDSDNYGTSGAAPSLYSDKHYLDGDGFLYGLGMASLRQIVKGKNDDIENYFYWNGGKSTTAKLGLNVSTVEEAIKGIGLFISAGRLNVNVGQGLHIGTNSQHSATYNKININFFKKNVTIDGTASLFNTSGLELVTGTADDTGAPADGQLRIKLSETGSETSYINTSGLVLKDPGDIGNLHVTEGLMVNYDNVTIGLNASNQLEVKASAIVPNISGTNPIEVTTSGNTKTIGLKLLTGTHQGNISGMRIVEAGTVESGDTLLGGLAVNVQSPLIITDTGSSGSAVGLKGSEFIDWLGSGGSDFGLDSTLRYDTSNGRHVLGVNSSIAGTGLLWDNGSIGLDPDIIDDGLTIADTLKVKQYNGITVDSNGVSVKPYHGITVNNNGVSVKPKSNSGIAVDANGVSVKIKPASGIGVDSNGIYLKVASTSEIGGVKLGTPATIQGANPVNLPLFLDSNNVGNVRMYVFNSEAPSNPEAANLPYSASYIDTNYSTNTQIDTKIATAISDISGREYKIFLTLPTKGESQSWADFYAAYKKYIALVSNTGTAPDAYKEYILIVTNESTGECHWEQIGDTEFTTDNFVAKTDVLTQAEVASIVQDVFGF